METVCHTLASYHLYVYILYLMVNVEVIWIWKVTKSVLFPWFFIYTRIVFYQSRIDSRMEGYKDLRRVCALGFASWAVLVLVFGPGAEGWSKEGHVMTCRIAQVIPSCCCSSRECDSGSCFFTAVYQRMYHCSCFFICLDLLLVDGSLFKRSQRKSSEDCCIRLVHDKWLFQPLNIRSRAQKTYDHIHHLHELY